MYTGLNIILGAPRRPTPTVFLGLIFAAMKENLVYVFWMQTLAHNSYLSELHVAPHSGLSLWIGIFS